jgi:hypothetical protein
MFDSWRGHQEGILVRMEDTTSIQGQLAELKRLTEENNAMLKSMKRNALIMGIIKTVVWVVVLFGSYYLTMQFLEPYLGVLKGMPQAGDGGAQDWGALFEQYRQLLGQ